MVEGGIKGRARVDQTVMRISCAGPAHVVEGGWSRLCHAAVV